MVRPGDTLTNPVTGFRLRFLKTATETNGELLEVEATYAAFSARPPEHLHPGQQEDFEILAGGVRVCVAGTVRDLGAGERLRIPAGVRHAMWNPHGEEARMRWQIRPALRTEALFEMLMYLAQRGRTDRRGTPRLLDLAVLSRHYRRELAPARPPPVVQTALFGALAPLGQLLGARREAPPDWARSTRPV
jgi:mannose-6-phosphate isomerase-like protein (cupin superfamily)